MSKEIFTHDNQIYKRDIETSTCDVCSDEDTPASGLELVQTRQTHRLRHLTVQRDSGETKPAEDERQTLCVVDCSCEDYH
jgi:hypothetical protein